MSWSGAWRDWCVAYSQFSENCHYNHDTNLVCNGTLFKIISKVYIAVNQYKL